LKIVKKIVLIKKAKYFILGLPKNFETTRGASSPPKRTFGISKREISPIF
jgi:hypothetical protein